ncbi:hypothetical protein N7474_003079 [Penicillium riverlandense]|uniref:uncharacterized protein n=1 Tax=Penicillium riverlandense TaxID=1903569 RepID=UPI0025498CE8|nr:uncharacterized protein N7474_003079 [Penicillium riverlandense]KAJ5825941.1 hypothetical protein N7474_003079 [Penicillium riverlandense]
MAHQAQEIPWKVLGSNLHWVSGDSCKCGTTNLHPRMRKNQAKALNDFVKAFLRNIDKHSNHERTKFRAKYDIPDRTDVIIDESVAQKIMPTVLRYRHYGRRNDFLCPGVASESRDHRLGYCQCPALPDQERSASSFLRRYIKNRCYRFVEDNNDAFFNLELVKTLILYGEMNPVLRICAHPEVDLMSWWSKAQCDCMDLDIGWDRFAWKALIAYIGLNVTFCFPQMWDAARGKPVETDYRNTRFYQYMLRECTMTGETSDVSAYPHRQFFGISEDQFRGSTPSLQSRNPRFFQTFTRGDDYRREYYGIVPIDEFLHMEGSVCYQPHLSDVNLVRSFLRRKGLPAELACNIMEFAEYEPRRRLKKPHDPFHRSNRKELAEYLKYCWTLLVRCDMMAKALDFQIPWKDLVTQCMVCFWQCRNCQLEDWFYVDDENRAGLSYTFAHRIVTQVVVTGARVFGRAFAEAYKQAQASGKYAAQNKGKNGGGFTSSGLTLDEACKILNVKPPNAGASETGLEQVMERFKKLFDLNDPQKGGSFYLQSKILRARERLEMEVREAERKAASEKELKEGWKPKVYKDR